MKKINSTTGSDQTRSRRWNRRDSDGASFNNVKNNLSSEENDDSTHVSSWQSIVEAEPLLSREPFHFTEELKERITASGRASLTTLITLSLLIFSGQGESIIILL